MTNPLQQIAKTGLTEQVDLYTYETIKAALKTQIVFCDTAKGIGIPVREVKRFSGTRGYQVYTLEGWTFPERVYYVTRK